MTRTPRPGHCHWVESYQSHESMNGRYVRETNAWPFILQAFWPLRGMSRAYVDGRLSFALPYQGPVPIR